MAEHCVLIVDDEKKFADTLSKRIQLRGIPSEVVHDGRSALKALEKKRFKAILLDLRLPDISGIEVLRRFRRTNSDTPVIIITGHGSEDDRRRCTALAANAFLHKPVNIDELTRLLAGGEDTT